MFGWLFPRCPVDTREKYWVESRMIWLVERFGIERLRRVEVLLPTDSRLPQEYHPDESNARVCFDVIARFMGIEPESISLEIVDGASIPGASGIYFQGEKSNILISRDLMDQPPRLLATISHELAHELLLKGGHLSADEADHEFVTDLLPVFLGLGIFMANSPLVIRNWHSGGSEYTQVSKSGYLNSMSLGYAIAVFCHLRGENRIACAKHLRTDARVTAEEGLRYIRRTGDTLIDLKRISPESLSPNSRIASWLKSRFATSRLAGLMDLHAPNANLDEFADAIVSCLNFPDEEVQSSAIRLLSRISSPPSNLLELLASSAFEGSLRIRETAILVLGELTGRESERIAILVKSLGDHDQLIVRATSEALRSMGSAAEPAFKPALAPLERFAALADDSTTAFLVAALLAMSDKAESRIKAHFATRDPDTRRVVLHALRLLLEARQS